MKRTIRLRESELRRMIAESVKRALNEIGETDKYHGMLGMSDGYYSYMGNTEKANRAYNLSKRLQKNRNNGQLYDPHSEESAAEYRRNARAYRSGYGRGRDKAKAEKEKLKSQVAESVRRVLNEMYPEYYNSDGGVNAGYSGRDGYGNLHGYVSRDEAQMRSVFQKLKNYGKIGYDYFEDWKRAGYPHANEV